MTVPPQPPVHVFLKRKAAFHFLMNLNTMGSVEGGEEEAHISPYLGFLLRAIVLKEKLSGSLEG